MLITPKDRGLIKQLSKSLQLEIAMLEARDKAHKKAKPITYPKTINEITLGTVFSDSGKDES